MPALKSRSPYHYAGPNPPPSGGGGGFLRLLLGLLLLVALGFTVEMFRFNDSPHRAVERVKSALLSKYFPKPAPTPEPTPVQLPTPVVILGSVLGARFLDKARTPLPIPQHLSLQIPDISLATKN